MNFFSFEIQQYADSLDRFTIHNELRKTGLLKKPDHVGIYPEDDIDYYDLLDQLSAEGHKVQLTDIGIGGSLTTVAKFTNGTEFNHQWLVDKFAIRKPDSYSRYDELKLVGYMAFVANDLAEAEDILTARKKQPQRQHDGYNEWLSLSINRRGQDLWFIKNGLEKVIGERPVEGAAKLL